MKNLFVRRILLLLIIGTMTINLTACSSKKQEVQEVIDEFEYACQTLDDSAILNCIDPDVAQIIRAAKIIIGSISDIDTEDLLDKFVEVVFGTEFSGNEFLRKITIEDEKISVKKESATVKCNICFEIEGEQFRKNATISLKENDERWYISKVDLKK